MWSMFRVGHTGLNASLHLVGRHPNGLCGYCGEMESVEHVLLHCRRPVFRLARDVLKREFMSLTGRDISVKVLLSAPSRALFRFLQSTRLYVRI